MSKLQLGQRVKSTWQGGAVGTVVYRRDTGSLPAFDNHHNADDLRDLAVEDDDFVVLFDDTQHGQQAGEWAGELYYAYDDDGDTEAIE